MTTQEAYTENIADFGARERGELQDLLKAWDVQGLPEDFIEERVRPAFNRNSGFVFLTNEDYEVAMMNGEKLESFYSCPECGWEGFKEDMLHNPENKECREYLKSIGIETKVRKVPS